MDEHDSSDSILIEQLEVYAHIGVPDHERAQPQRLTFHIALQPHADFRDLNDEIHYTINYATVARAVREFVETQHVRLIETLAEKVAQHLLDNFPIRQISIELRKYVLPDAQFVAVRLTRSRS